MTHATKRWLALLIVCLAPFFTAAASYEFLLHKTYAQRVQLTDSLVFPGILEMPYAGALRTMHLLEQKALAQGDKGLYCEMKLMHLHYYDFKELTNIDSTMRQLLDLRLWARRNHLPEYEVCINYDLANNYYRKRDYQKAFEHYISVCNTLEGLSAAKFPRKKEFLVYIGNRYYNFGDNASAKSLLLAADSLPPSAGNSLFRTNYNNKNTLGLVYRNDRQYDSALYCFRQVVQMAGSVNDSIWCGIAGGNIGITYYLQGSYAKAVPFLEQDVRTGFNVQRKFYDNPVNSLLILTDIYLSQHKLAEARKNIALAEQFVYHTVDTLKYRSMLYKAMAGLMYQTGDYRSSCLYKDYASLANDSLIRRDNKLLLSYARHKVDAQKHLLVLKELDTKRKLLRMERNVVIGILCAVLVISLLFFYYIRLRYKMRQSRLLSEKVLAEQELKGTTEQLKNYTRNLQEKNALIERSEREVLHLTGRLQAQEAATADNDILNRLYASTILTEEQWEEFKELFSKVHKGFLLRLREKIPNLSPAETRFIVMSKLKLSPREMASLLGVQPDSLRTYRHRLRKKLSLPEEASIEAMADAI